MTERITFYHGDCLDILREMEDQSIDSIVTDPPYGLSFMGKKWDYDVPGEEVWRECLRVLKPGGHLLAFAGTRTQHRMAVRIEDAGFEIRDMIAWVYGSGFPKSMDVSKAIDRAAGAEREVVGSKIGQPGYSMADNGRTSSVFADLHNNPSAECAITAPATAAARQWQGWGTALKPALEPITMARKPLIGTVAENVLTHGTGAINVDGCRVKFTSESDRNESTAKNQHENFGTKPLTGNTVYGDYSMVKQKNYNPPGRWPANLIHDGSEEVLKMFPDTGASRSGGKAGWQDKYVGGTYKPIKRTGYDESHGSSARFFYCAKASKADREQGCNDIEKRIGGSLNGRETRPDRPTNHPIRGNHHPTVKPTELMRSLVRMVTPPNGIVLDPFMGSGSTGKACVIEGFQFIGIEREEEYIKIAEARINAVRSLFT